MISNKGKIRRDDWLDSLRALAVIAVVIMHVATPALQMSYGKNMSAWFAANFYMAATRFAIPLFLMIIGATLLNRSYNLKTFYQKRFIRVLIPFIFWFFVYLIYRYYTLPTPVPVGVKSTLLWATQLFIEAGVSRHFWLVYMMLVIYLTVPLLSKIVRKIKPNMLVFLMAAWVLIAGIVKDFDINMISWQGNHILKLINYFTFAGYMVLGYYFYHVVYVSKNIRISAWILYVVTVFVAMGMSFFASKTDGELNTSIFHYYSLNTIVQSAAIFMAFKKSESKNKAITTIKNSISDFSYGIYLIHILVLSLFHKNGLFWTMTHPAISISLLSILTLAVSWSILFLLNKVPFIKFLTGNNAR